MSQATRLKFFALFFLVLLALPLVSAKSEIIMAPLADSDDTLRIQVPLFYTHEYGNDLSLRFHVYNTSTGEKMAGSEVSCGFHLYNTTNRAPYTTHDLDVGEGDYCFKADITAGNFTEPGNYYYYIHCNTTNFGGYAAASFEVTRDGKALASENIIIFFSILFLILIAGLLTLLIYDITRFSTLDFDVRDVIFNLSAYFVLFGTYMLEQEYLANANIERFLDMLVNAGAYVFVYLAIIMFAVCFIINLMNIRKENRRLK